MRGYLPLFDRYAFEPLSGLLAAETPENLDRVRDRLTSYPTLKLARTYEAMLFSGRRRSAYLLSEVLSIRGMPPCFRIEREVQASSLNESQRFDIFVHDLQWIAAHYPGQRDKAISGYKYLLAHDGWIERAEHMWVKKHQGGIWIIVRQMGLDVDLQWECNMLRSKPVKLAAQGLVYRRATVRKAIMAKLPEAMLRRHEGDARMTLDRRYRIWVCGEMTANSPTKAARLYSLWTGNEIARSVADRDVEWVRRHIPESRKRRNANAANSDMQ